MKVFFTGIFFPLKKFTLIPERCLSNLCRIPFHMKLCIKEALFMYLFI